MWELSKNNRLAPKLFLLAEKKVVSMEYFIWTEAIGCGEILPPCLESFLKHHDEKIHVFGYPEDLINLPKSNQIVPMQILDDALDSKRSNYLTFSNELKIAYKNGHEGTALLWAKIISNQQEELLIHLDSDTIFLKDVVSPILKKLREGFGIVGSRRPYKEQVRNGNVKGYRRLQFYFYRDAVNTYAFGFKRTEIQEMNYKKIQEKIMNRYSNRLFQRLFPVIDFFDAVTFQISRSKGIFYLDSNNQRKSGTHDRFGAFESSMISFAAVGSGCNFFKNPEAKTSESYKEFALASFSLYSKYLLGTDIKIPPLESPFLENLLEKLDKSTWTLKEI
jgi:hypothetical protein